MKLNLDTTFRVFRECARRFERAGGGAVVAVSAPAALLGEAGVGGYAAGKAGVLRMVESLAREMAPFGGRANAVLPGTMDTPANRAAMPDADPATMGEDRRRRRRHPLSDHPGRRRRQRCRRAGARTQPMSLSRLPRLLRLDPPAPPPSDCRHPVDLATTRRPPARAGAAGRLGPGRPAGGGAQRAGRQDPHRRRPPHPGGDGAGSPPARASAPGG